MNLTIQNGFPDHYLSPQKSYPQTGGSDGQNNSALEKNKKEYGQ